MEVEALSGGGGSPHGDIGLPREIQSLANQSPSFPILPLLSTAVELEGRLEEEEIARILYGGSLRERRRGQAPIDL